MKLPVDPHKVVDGPAPVVKDLLDPSKKPLARFPLLLAMLTTFGFVATLYGFEHLIDRVELFSNNPFILLAVGVLTLIATGTIYKKL